MTRDIAYFVSWCIEEYKNVIGKGGAETMLLLDKYGILQYLSDNYEVYSPENIQLVKDDTIYRIRQNRNIMNLEINQNNLHLLLPGKLSWMAEMYIEDHQTSVVDALKKLYQSSTYTLLEKENTKYWHYGPADLYRMVQEDTIKDLKSEC